jgi:hypothetical protein
MAFSLRKNIRVLMADLPAEGDINCIYGVRALCATAIYLFHTGIPLLFTPYSNRVAFSEVSILKRPEQLIKHLASHELEIVKEAVHYIQTPTGPAKSPTQVGTLCPFAR